MTLYPIWLWRNGDRFVVPRVPANVTVEGQVYSANAFVYQPEQRVLDYLKRAGGPDRQADRKRMFLLRADGSVVSRQYNNVEKTSIFPGDTVVVPADAGQARYLPAYLEHRGHWSATSGRRLPRSRSLPGSRHAHEPTKMISSTEQLRRPPVWV